MRRRAIRSVLSLLIAFAVCVAFSQRVLAGRYDPIWVNAAGTDRAGILRVLDAPTEIQCKQMPLSKVIEKFRSAHHLEIQLDHKAFEEARVTLDTPVTFEVQGATVRQAMNLILRPIELTWVIRDGALRITTVSQAESLEETVIYPVEDLLLPPAELRVPGRQYVPDYDSLIELMTSTIDPTTWQEGTGPGPVHRFPGALILRQTQPVLEDVADLLSELRIARDAQFPSAAKLAPGAEKNARLRAADVAFAALHKPLELNLSDASLDELAKQISSRCKIPAAIDVKALEEASIELHKVRFNRRLPNLPLHAALDRLLEGFELNCAIRDGVLLITTQSTSETIVDARVYKISGLGERPRFPLSTTLAGYPYPGQRLTEDFVNVEELVTSTIAPAFWAEVGGPGAIKPFANAGVLVVSQSSRVQVEVEQCLAALRQFRAEHPHDGEQPPPGEDELVMVAYPVSAGSDRVTEEVQNKTDKATETRTTTRTIEATLPQREQSARQWVRALPKLVAPEAWGAGGGSIQVVGDVLYIRQRMAVHEQISKLLPQPVWRMGRLFPPR